MKIVITASEPNLESSVDPRFGRSPYFILLDTDTMEFESIENPNISALGGAGIQSAQLIADKGAKALLTGSCGEGAPSRYYRPGAPLIGQAVLRLTDVRYCVGATVTLAVGIDRHAFNRRTFLSAATPKLGRLARIASATCDGAKCP